MRTPTPMPVWMPPGLIDDIDRHRRDECTHYGHCVARASTERWYGSSCSNCDAFTVAPEGPVEVSLAQIGGRPSVLLSDDEEDDGEPGDAQGEMDADEDDVPVSDIVLTAELDGGLHLVLQGGVVIAEARRLGELTVKASLIGRARCPVCAERLLPGLGELPGRILRDGFCTRCLGFLEPEGAGVVLRADERSRLFEMLSREKRAHRIEARTRRYRRMSEEAA